MPQVYTIKQLAMQPVFTNMCCSQVLTEFKCVILTICEISPLLDIP